MCRAAAGDDRELYADILRLQNELFVAGAELATAPEAANRLEPGTSQVTTEMVDALEYDIDRYMARVDLPPKFVIPGGTELSARLDVARVRFAAPSARRVELKPAGDRAGRDGAQVTSTAPPMPSTRWPATRTTENPKLFEGRR